MDIITQNRKASFLYHLISTYEAGIQLKGSEVKSIREGNINIKDSYVKIKNFEMFIVGMYIGEYSHKGYSTHEPTRERKLLMHKSEIEKIYKDFENKGKTIIPTKLYFKNGKAKIQIALAKGKKNWDKRDSKKQKDIDREIKRSMKG
jgi:SsrA-binding protein|tara:strand:- start:6 stop:446 length:441 start_codon:yes stop_codon:yes gene_type:complete